MPVNRRKPGVRRPARGPSSWVGVLIVGLALVALGVLVALVTYQPPLGSIHPLAWACTVSGAVLTGVAVGNVP